MEICKNAKCFLDYISAGRPDTAAEILSNLANNCDHKIKKGELRTKTHQPMYWGDCHRIHILKSKLRLPQIPERPMRSSIDCAKTTIPACDCYCRRFEHWWLLSGATARRRKSICQQQSTRYASTQTSQSTELHQTHCSYLPVDRLHNQPFAICLIRQAKATDQVGFITDLSNSAMAPGLTNHLIGA